MMDSIIPVIVSKKNKQTKENMSFITLSVSQIHINLEKIQKKNTKHNDVFTTVSVVRTEQFFFWGGGWWGRWIGQ